MKTIEEKFHYIVLNYTPLDNAPNVDEVLKDMLQFESELGELLRQHAIEFAEHTLKKAGYPKDLQPYVGLPGVYKKWIKE